jgi:ketosteroid isomerase-like protein
MSSRHAASIVRLNAAFNSREVEGWLADATEDCEIESRFASVAGTIYRGSEGVVAWWADLAEAWEWMELEIHEGADVAPDRTVILATLRGVGRESGLRLDEPIAQNWYWREERLARIDYLDRREAASIVGGQPPR